MDRSDVIIDNATLSGVQRLLGHSKTLNTANAENDICCLERLLNSIVFSEKIHAIDDYIGYHRDSRHKSFPYINMISKYDVPYDDISKEASKYAESLIFDIKDAKPVGDAVYFFEALKVHPQVRWDVFTSSEYLTLSYLVRDRNNINYESGVSASFGNENADADRSGRAITAPKILLDGSEVGDVKSLIHEISKNNPNFKGMGHRDTLEKVIFGFGWCAERSFFYNECARHLGGIARLSPLRDTFCEGVMLAGDGADIRGLISNLNDSASDCVSSILKPSGMSQFALRLPFMTSYFLSICESPAEAIDAAYEQRERSEFVNCRNILSNLQHLEGLEKYTEINSIYKGLNEALKALLEKTNSVDKSSAGMGLAVGFAGPTVSFNKSLGSLFANYRNRHFGRMYRSMATDMINTERLGTLFEKATKSILKHKDNRWSEPSVTPDYLENKSTDYGRPINRDR
ncbi:hypothetical protein [Fulvimarina pelagi]|uniref:hypothetical protein n=1 Tax=Fulvimarina pelagi TaxID=217511 RepID=UPI00031C309E|nr:hypothetical protein [Fulvimarina pelagi]